MCLCVKKYWKTTDRETGSGLGRYEDWIRLRLEIVISDSFVKVRIK